MHRRVAAHGWTLRCSTPSLTSGFDALVSTYFDEKRFGIEGSVRAKLRRELIRAGFFRADAINYYIFARLAAVVILPIVGYLLAEQFLINREWYLKFGVGGYRDTARGAGARCLHCAPHKEIAPGISDRLS